MRKLAVALALGSALKGETDTFEVDREIFVGRLSLSIKLN